MLASTDNRQRLNHFAKLFSIEAKMSGLSRENCKHNDVINRNWTVIELKKICNNVCANHDRLEISFTVMVSLSFI